MNGTGHARNRLWLSQQQLCSDWNLHHKKIKSQGSFQDILTIDPVDNFCLVSRKHVKSPKLKFSWVELRTKPLNRFLPKETLIKQDNKVVPDIKQIHGNKSEGAQTLKQRLSRISEK